MIPDTKAYIEEVNKKLQAVRLEMGKTVVGQERLITRMLIALLADGHLLVEGVPGIAKTLAVNTFSKVLKLDFKRIQFTPDLLPADLIGTTIYNPKEGNFSVQKGPVFTNIVLADEINRAPPKVQSALLEVMQEKQVTIGGQTFKTGVPFLVFATQNPIEQEGTYPLPEAETDRFMMKVEVSYPTEQEERTIVLRYTQEIKPEIPIPVMMPEDIVECRAALHSIYLDEKILTYILDIVAATRGAKDNKGGAHELLEYGASPRASIWLTMASKAHALLDGRAYVTPYDVQEIAFDVLRHRLVLSYAAEAEEVTADTIIQRILDTIAVP